MRVEVNGLPMQQDFPEEFQWLAELAREVNQLSGFYTNQETAAIYCPNCQTIQAYCTGCGKKLIDVYNEDTHDCENCGIPLTHCGICGYVVEEQMTAPADLQKPEYWKYCPACGDAIFAVTDMCPSCKVSMATHLDNVYEETYARVNQTVIEEEAGESIYDRKGKAKYNQPIKLNLYLNAIEAGMNLVSQGRQKLINLLMPRGSKHHNDESH